jgi:hypothetical protein
MLSHPEKELWPGNIQLLFKTAYDWRFVPVSGLKESTNRAIYMCKSVFSCHEGITEMKSYFAFYCSSGKELGISIPKFAVGNGFPGPANVGASFPDSNLWRICERN